MTRFRATPQHIVALVLVAAFAFLYRDVIAKLVSDWGTDDNYSHGFLIVPVALYFAWERRGRLLAACARVIDHGNPLALSRRLSQLSGA